jgi:uncharacterized protein YqgV (UPF0045/DUF77 family)
VLRAEFTVEPFVEGQPGPHVLAAVAAVEARGFTVEFGPFASEFSGDDAGVIEAIEALVREAYAHGATRVALHVERSQVDSASAGSVQ